MRMSVSLCLLLRGCISSGWDGLAQVGSGKGLEKGGEGRGAERSEIEDHTCMHACLLAGWLSE